MKRTMLILVAALLILSLCACAGEPAATSAPESTANRGSEQATSAAPATDSPATDSPATDAPETDAPVETDAPEVEGVELNVYSLKGPTSMGLVTLLRDSKEGKTVNTYNSTMCAAADEVTAALVNGDADIALLPANAAAALFNKAGGFSVVAINTLGVLYVVENGQTIFSVKDLSGKTVYMTGKGTVPEYTLRHILAANGIEDQVTLEFKSEPQEVVSAMAEDAAAVGLLPQPFVTAALAQNENLCMVLDLNREWNAIHEDSAVVTGVTVVRNEILERYPAQVKAFLREAKEGVLLVNQEPEAAAELIAEMGIVAKAPLALRALPFCSIVCITGSEMQALLSSYLQTLFDQNPKAVGGAMPADVFYYLGE